MKGVCELGLKLKNMKMSTFVIVSYFIKYALPEEERPAFKEELTQLSHDTKLKYSDIEALLAEFSKGRV